MMDNLQKVLVVAAIEAIQQLQAACYINFDDMQTKVERRGTKK
jgi:hypothetical protein